MSSKSPLEERRAQQREAGRIFREKQQKNGLYQATFWMTMRQAVAVREWLRRGGDVAALRNGVEKGEHHG